jgi:hypothetical protein
MDDWSEIDILTTALGSIPQFDELLRLHGLARGS